MNNFQFDQETFAKLTDKEIEVARAAADGKTCKETAAYLGMGPRTAESHRYRIIHKTGASTFTQAVVRLVRGGII